MRFKVSLEYIQSTDPSDFYKLTKGKKPMSVMGEYIEQHIKNSIISAIQDAIDGHGYTMLGLQESLKYAAEDNLVNVKVKYLDDNWGVDLIDVEKVL